MDQNGEKRPSQAEIMANQPVVLMPKRLNAVKTSQSNGNMATQTGEMSALAKRLFAAQAKTSNARGVLPSQASLLASQASSLFATQTSDLLASQASGLLASQASGMASQASTVLTSQASGLLPTQKGGKKASKSKKVLPDQQSELAANQVSLLIQKGILMPSQNGNRIKMEKKPKKYDDQSKW